LPRIASILIAQFAWELQKMLAGFVLLSAAIGMVFVAATVALSVPLWVTVVAYPAICSLTLLLCAALWNIRTGSGAQRDRVARGYSHG
jgi:hypothetical protein